MTLSRAELQTFAGVSVPDLVGDELRLLFVGINPSLLSAATGLHFAHAGNRFYPALRAAGILEQHALTPAAAAPLLVRRGVGITNLVARATARADELDDDEVRDGRARLESFVDVHRPRVVAVAGITAYRLAFKARQAVAGRQERAIHGSTVFVVPNPSGLNAHATVPSLARDYRAAAEASDIPLLA